MKKTRIKETALEKLLGKELSTAMKPHMEEGEKIRDVLIETYGPDLTIRRLVLTNHRIIIAIVRLMGYEFKDLFLQGIDIEFKQGPFYDDIILRTGLENYIAHTYAAKRLEVKNFMDHVREERDQLEQAEMEQEAEVAEEASGGSHGEAHGITHAIKELADLKNKGEVSEKEFKENKKALLDKL
jgi:hypothetical protein